MTVAPFQSASTEHKRGRHVAVIGGGAVGVCSAVYLLQSGFDVTLIDPVEPGSPQQCSFGNAGSLAPGSCIPNAMPGIVYQLPKLLMDPESPISVRLLDIPHALPWIARFLWASRQQRVREIADAMIALNKHCLECYQPLIRAAGCEDLIRVRGQLFAYEDPNGAHSAKLPISLRRERGVRVEILDEFELRELEPAIGPAYRSGLYLPDNGQCINPGRLIASLWKLAVGMGGHHVRSRCLGFHFGPNGPVAAKTEETDVFASNFVIAAGVQSRDLVRKLGTRLPLIAERGYHVMIEDPQVSLRLQISSVSRKFAAASMEGGLRLSGTAEFARVNSSPRWDRAELLVRQGKHMFPGLKISRVKRWVGSRPSMPDSIPVIERSPQHANVIFAFGHGHQGLIGASITGKLVSELVSNRPTTIDLYPYRSARFRKFLQ